MTPLMPVEMELKLVTPSAPGGGYFTEQLMVQVDKAAIATYGARQVWAAYGDLIKRGSEAGDFGPMQVYESPAVPGKWLGFQEVELGGGVTIHRAFVMSAVSALIEGSKS